MALHADIPRVAMQVSRGVVVASIQIDLDEDVLAQFREDLLGRIHESGARAAILDVSGVETLDSEELATLRRIIAMTDLMGAQSVLAGLRPGVVSALIEAGADVDGLRAAVNLDAAFDLLQPELESEAETELDSGTEPEGDMELDGQDAQEGGPLPEAEKAPEVGR